MPRASIGSQDEKFDLETCPGGYVILRRMPYGKWLERQQMSMTMKFEGVGGKNVNAEAGLENVKVTAFEFKECIVEHNLEKDENGTLFDFRKGASELQMLDPRVGNEIGQRITELHEFDLGNSNTGSDPSLF